MVSATLEGCIPQFPKIQEDLGMEMKATDCFKTNSGSLYMDVNSGIVFLVSP